MSIYFLSDLIPKLHALKPSPKRTPAGCRGTFDPFGALKSAIKTAATSPSKDQFDFEGRWAEPGDPENRQKAREVGDIAHLELLYFAFDILHADGEACAPLLRVAPWRCGAGLRCVQQHLRASCQQS